MVHRRPSCAGAVMVLGFVRLCSLLGTGGSRDGRAEWSQWSRPTFVVLTQLLSFLLGDTLVSARCGCCSPSSSSSSSPGWADKCRIRNPVVAAHLLPSCILGCPVLPQSKSPPLRQSCHPTPDGVIFIFFRGGKALSTHSTCCWVHSLWMFGIPQRRASELGASRAAKVPSSPWQLQGVLVVFCAPGSGVLLWGEHPQIEPPMLYPAQQRGSEIRGTSGHRLFKGRGAQRGSMELLCCTECRAVSVVV